MKIFKSRTPMHVQITLDDALKMEARVIDAEDKLKRTEKLSEALIDSVVGLLVVVYLYNPREAWLNYKTDDAIRKAVNVVWSDNFDLEIPVHASLIEPKFYELMDRETEGMRDMI